MRWSLFVADGTLYWPKSGRNTTKRHDGTSKKRLESTTYSRMRGQNTKSRRRNTTQYFGSKKMNVMTVKQALEKEVIKILIHGLSGMGKTSLIKTLPCKPEEVLLIAADPGQLALRPVPKARLEEKGLPEYLGRDFTGVHYLAPKTMEEFREAAKYMKAAAAAKKYKFFYVDGLDEIGEDALKFYKDDQRSKAKPNMQAAYGDMADMMANLIGGVLDLPVASIFVTHTAEDEESDTRCQPAFPGKKFACKIPDMFDEVWCLRPARKTPTSKPERLLQTNPMADTKYKTKSRSGVLDDFESPDLTSILSRIFN